MARRAVEFLRRHPGLVLVVGVVALVLGTTVNRALEGSTASTSAAGGEEGSGSESEDPPRSGNGEDEPPDVSDEPGDVHGRTGDAEGRSGAQADGTGTTGTTRVPPDVARPRPDVDLDTPPDGSDPVEVARWWAAVYVAYGGAEPPGDLADRLGPASTRALQDDLRSLPPAASYDEPVPIEGVSARDPAGDRSGGQVGQNVWVTVETPGALVVYRVALQDDSGEWRVSEASRL